ncbi:hypothetical protein WQ57_09925 [Mesobacillus campisalis]|uniref:Uncharacterized protein n=1 Tax=Mesobacillus campisalis TaxID=1408103 RepID=A0A0M2T070_9BACI|nr:hypothetical protein WQ57_09925 [Mesobacillus campisalis]
MQNASENINSIGNSGNSDIDLNVEVKVDTTAIGFAVLCTLLATGQMNELQFQEAVRKMEELTQEKIGHFYGKGLNDSSSVRLFKREGH